MVETLLSSEILWIISGFSFSLKVSLKVSKISGSFILYFSSGSGISKDIGSDFIISSLNVLGVKFVKSFISRKLFSVFESREIEGETKSSSPVSLSLTAS